MKINVKRVLEDQDEKRIKPKPLPKIRTAGTIVQQTVSVPETPTPVQQTQPAPSEKDQLLRDLREQLNIVKVERGKLATRTSYLVDEVAEKIRKSEGPAVAKAFLDGEIAMPEIAEHAAKIQAWIDKGAAIYDQIKHVELYGKLPEVIAKDASTLVAQQTVDTKALKYELRCLDKLISKTSAKISEGKPKNPSRVATWKEKIALAEARRDEIKHQIKRIEYEARAERNNS